MVKSEKLLKGALPAVGLASTLLFPSSAQAQEYDPYKIGYVDPTARLGVLAVNVGVNGLLCGVVGAINERNFFKDARKCMIGGTFQYVGMEMGMHDVPALPGVGLRFVETGTSIIENTLAGREPFERLHYELGPLLYQINFKENGVDGVETYWRITPVIGLVANFVQGHRLNWPETFSYQTFMFNFDSVAELDNPVTSFTSANGIENPKRGYTLGNVMVYDQKYPAIAAHEFDHVLQYVRFRPAQLLVPESLHFLEDTLHYRAGEDAASLFFHGTNNLECVITKDPYCQMHWWNVAEAEAYVMMTGHEKYKKIF